MRPLLESHFGHNLGSNEDPKNFSENFNQACIRIMQEHYPKSVETTEGVIARSAHLKTEIAEFMKKEANRGKRVAIVGHNMMLRIMTAN